MGRAFGCFSGDVFQVFSHLVVYFFTGKLLGEELAAMGGILLELIVITAEASQDLRQFLGIIDGISCAALMFEDEFCDRCDSAF